MTNTPPGDNPAARSPVRLKLQEDGFLNGRRCTTLEMATTTDAGIEEVLQHAASAAMRLIVPKSFPGSAGALVLRTDLLNGRLPNTHIMALALAGGILCRRHANRTRSNRTTTVWACLPGWQRDGATRIYRNRPRPLQARDTATFLPTADRRQPGGDGEAGHHPSTLSTET